MNDVQDRDRVKGCLMGGAVDDALGAPIEFTDRHSLPQALVRNSTPPAYLESDGKGRITDDTQMTLFTAEGLIRAAVRQEERGVCAWESVVDHAYGRWLQTQGRKSERWGAFEPDGWLFERSELHVLRAPGNTCLTALMAPEAGSPDAPINNSKGCGGVMRVAPVGLVRSASLEERFRLGSELAALTHGHPSGYLAAGFLAVVIGTLLDGRPMEVAIYEARRELSAWPESDEVLKFVNGAIQNARRYGAPTPKQIDEFGAGWVAEEALGIALWCALSADDFLSGVTAAVAHSGDSDSTGAIAGSLLGAASGIEAIPAELIDDLQECPIVERVADDMHTAFIEGDVTENRRLVERYPGW